MKLLASLLASTLLLTQATTPTADKGPELGKPAPTFRLNDQTGQAHTIGGKSRAWTVVAFYPKAMTPG